MSEHQSNDRLKVYRDASPPAFTADCPAGSHPAWYFSIDGRSFGPYYTRRDAAEAAEVFLAREMGAFA